MKKITLLLIITLIILFVKISASDAGMFNRVPPTQKSVIVNKKTATPIKKVGPIKLSNSAIIKKLKPAVVYISTDSEAGSGMIVDTKGYVLTNAHVVSGVDNANITISDGRSFDAVVVGRDENIDLAILKMSGKFHNVELGNSDNTQQGDAVYALGFPFGLKGDVSFKDGTISRTVSGTEKQYFETSVEIYPGNSGGPLVNQYGQVIGVNTLSYGNSVNGVAVGESIKLAIPINVAKKIMDKLKSGENILLPTESDLNNKICTTVFGIYSVWSGATNSQGSPTCVCQSGYSWDATGNACTSQDALLKECQTRFGIYSYSHVQNGKAVCDCIDGYVWNIDQTICVQISKDKICKDKYGINSIWSGIINSNGGPTCDCQAGYSWNLTNTACIFGCSSGQCMLNGSCVIAPSNSYCSSFSLTGWNCNPGYYEVGGYCFSFSDLDNGCKSTMGIGSYFNGTIENGKYNCDCYATYYSNGSYCLIKIY